MRTRLIPLLLTTASLVAFGLGLPSCAELPEVATDTCGNAVVEPGEDCDGSAGDLMRCRAPGTPFGCRFDCTRNALGYAPRCPSGWGCGVDGVCREPRGKFVALDSLAAEVDSVLLGDFDGDRRNEIVAMDRPSAEGITFPRVLFVDPKGSLNETLFVQAPVVSPEVAALDDNDSQDLVFGVRGRIGALVGRNGALEPLAYSELSSAKLRLARIRGLASSNLSEGVLLLANTALGNFVYAPTDTPGTYRALAVMPAPPDAIAGDPLTAPVDPISPCDELLIAFRAAPEIWKLVTCDPQGNWRTTLSSLQVATTLPEYVNGAVHAADVDADGAADLVVGGRSGATYVALSQGDGTFAPATALQFLLQPGLIALDQIPLTAGDLNEDGRADFVTPTDVLLAETVTPDGAGLAVHVRSLASKVVGEWSVARIADLNNNGLADVIAGSRDGLELDFFNGAPQAVLNPARIPTGGPVGHLVVGDFDGDLVADVGYTEPGNALDSESLDSLFVAFGRHAGPPEDPIRVGSFPPVRQLFPAFFADTNTIESLAVISTAGDDRESEALLLGSGDRQLLAPFSLSYFDESARNSVIGIPLVVAAGRLTAGNRADLVVLAIDSSDSPAPGTLRMWIAPGIEKTSREPILLGEPLPGWQIAPTGGPSGISALLHTEDLDGDRIEEIVMVAPYGTAGEASALLVARAVWVADGLRLSLGEPTPIGAPFPVGPGSAFAMVDLDGDHEKDGVVLVSDGAQRSVLLVMWNDGAGHLNTASPYEISLPSGIPRAFAAVHAQVDASPQLLVLSDTAAFLVQRDPSQSRALRVSPMESVGGGSAVAAGDVTGDGIDDLAIVQGGNARLYLGEPALL